MNSRISLHLCPILEAPSHISYSPVTRYPLLYSGHASNFQTSCPSLAHVRKANPTKQSSKIQTAYWQWSLASTSLPNRAHELCGRWLLLTALSCDRGHTSIQDHCLALFNVLG